jgi:aminoglycoside phosphotransferase
LVGKKVKAARGCSLRLCANVAVSAVKKTSSALVALLREDANPAVSASHSAMIAEYALGGQEGKSRPGLFVVTLRERAVSAVKKTNSTPVALLREDANPAVSASHSAAIAGYALGGQEGESRPGLFVVTLRERAVSAVEKANSAPVALLREDANLAVSASHSAAIAEYALGGQEGESRPGLFVVTLRK